MTNKETIIGVVEHRDPSKRIDALTNKIQQEFDKSIDLLTKVFHDYRNIIPNLSIPKITRLPMLIENNPIIAVIDNSEKEKFRVLILQQEYPVRDVSVDWVVENRIKYIVELISTEEDVIKWGKSENFFSAKVVCGINRLHNVLLDIFIDSVMENSLVNNKEFKDICSKRKIATNSIDNTRKVKFVKSQFLMKIEEGMTYIPFSKFFRDNITEKYNIRKAYNFWQKYLFELTDNKEEFRTVKEYKELITYLPTKFRNQVNKKHLMRVFQNKCSNDGYYYYVYMNKSTSGLPVKIKKRLESIFNGTPKPGAQTIIPLAFSHILNELEHLCIIILFEKGKKHE